MSKRIIPDSQLHAGEDDELSWHDGVMERSTFGSHRRSLGGDGPETYNLPSKVDKDAAVIAINTGHAGREHIDMASDPGATTVRRSTRTHDREQTSDVGHTRPTTRIRPQLTWPQILVLQLFVGAHMHTVVNRQVRLVILVPQQEFAP